MAIMQVMTSKSPIQFIANTTGTVPANSNTILTFSGHQTGDFLLAIAANAYSISDSAIYNNNGWTKIKSFANDGGSVGFRVSGVFYYKYASSTANEVLTLSSGIIGWAGSVGLIFRNVRDVGSSNVSNTTAGSPNITSIPTPTLTLSDTTTAKSMLVLSTYNFSANMSMSGMNTILNRGCLYGENKASWQGGNMTVSGGLYPNCGIVELLY